MLDPGTGWGLTWPSSHWNPELDCCRGELKRDIDPLPVHPGPKLLLFILCPCPIPFFLYLCNLEHVAVPYRQSPLSLCHQREIFPICSFTVYENKKKKQKFSVFVYTRVWATMSTTIKQIHRFQSCGPFFWRASAEDEELTHWSCSISLHLRHNRASVVSLGFLVAKPQKKAEKREEAAGGV